MSVARIAINGRFLTQRVTGVQRFAREALMAMDHLLGQSDYAFLRDSIELLVPPVGADVPRLENIVVKSVGQFGGYFWEQFELPWYTRGEVLVGLCGLGPLLKKRQLVVFHDVTYLAVPDTFTPKVRFVYSVMVPALLRRAQRSFAVSAFTRDELARHLGADPTRIAVCGEGGDHIIAVPADTSVLERNDLVGKRYFVAVGVGGANKNPQVLLDAIEHMQDSDVLLVVTGKRNPKVHKGTAIELSSLVRTTGYVSDAELRALYENALALVYPSSYEGFGLPPIEAMTCGCPSVVSDQPALVEVGGDTGLYFAGNDSHALAALLTRLRDNDAFRLQAAAHGKARATRFVWSQTAATLLDACRSM